MSSPDATEISVLRCFLDEMQVPGEGHDLLSPLPFSIPAWDDDTDTASDTTSLPAHSESEASCSPIAAPSAPCVPPEDDDNVLDPLGVKKRRRREKEELAFLHVRVQELQVHLQHLREHRVTQFAKARDVTDALCKRSMGSEHEMATFEGVVALEQVMKDKLRDLWQSAAANERQREQRAYVDNIALRGMVNDLVVTAKRLDAFLQSNAACDPTMDSPSRLGIDERLNFRWQGEKEKDRDVEAETFEALTNQLPFLYAQTDLMLCRNPHLEHCGGDSGISFGSDEAGKFLEISQARLFPFPWQPSGDAVWAMLSEPLLNLQSGVYIHHGGSADTIRAKVVDLLCFSQGQAPAAINVVCSIHRIVEPGRFVVVVAFQVKVAGTVCTSMRCRAWGIITPFHCTDMTQAPLGACHARVHLRIYPEADTAGPENSSAVTNFALDAANRIMGIAQEGVLRGMNQVGA